MSLKTTKKASSNEKPSVWDTVTSSFSLEGSGSELYLPGKENYDVVWPILYQVILCYSEYNEDKDLRACDFGCGTGILAEQLNQLFFRTFACDLSEQMITKARELSHSNVVFDVGSLDFVRDHAPYQLITAIMVFQFIDNLRPTIKVLSESLERDGILFFAIHNPEYIRECGKYDVKFRGFKDNDLVNPTCGEISINDIWINTFIRSPEWYDSVLLSEGFVNEGAAYRVNKPPYELLDRGFDLKWNASKYYIAWYRNAH